MYDSRLIVCAGAPGLEACPVSCCYVLRRLFNSFLADIIYGRQVTSIDNPDV